MDNATINYKIGEKYFQENSTLATYACGLTRNACSILRYKFIFCGNQFEKMKRRGQPKSISSVSLDTFPLHHFFTFRKKWWFFFILDRAAIMKKYPEFMAVEYAKMATKYNTLMDEYSIQPFGIFSLTAVTDNNNKKFFIEFMGWDDIEINPEIYSILKNIIDNETRMGYRILRKLQLEDSSMIYSDTLQFVCEDGIKRLDKYAACLSNYTDKLVFTLDKRSDVTYNRISQAKNKVYVDYHDYELIKNQLDNLNIKYIETCKYEGYQAPIINFSNKDIPDSVRLYFMNHKRCIENEIRLLDEFCDKKVLLDNTVKKGIDISDAIVAVAMPLSMKPIIEQPIQNLRKECDLILKTINRANSDPKFRLGYEFKQFKHSVVLPYTGRKTIDRIEDVYSSIIGIKTILDLEGYKIIYIPDDYNNDYYYRNPEQLSEFEKWIQTCKTGSIVQSRA